MKPPLGFTGRSILTLDDLSDSDMLTLIEFAEQLKARRQNGVYSNFLEHKSVAMVFEKSSTRTRCAVSTAVAEEGGHAEYLSAGDIHLGYKESVPDTARVLGRMFHGIMYRGFKQSTAEQLAEHSGVPVWNGLTDQTHPTQALADLMTVKEALGRLKGLKVAYIGDGRNNVANSLMLACAKAGMHFVNCTPPELSPPEELVAHARVAAERNASTIQVIPDPVTGVAGANVLYTDVWVSMGEEDKSAERIALLKPYQVTMDLVKATGNLEAGEVIFLHCLPAFHDSNTKVTAESGPLEVTDEVFEAPFSRVFDEAENRMHTTKALFVAGMADIDADQ